jgi:hypothetical protein
VIAALVAFLLATGLIALGRWGRRNAADLVPTSFSPAGRAKKERSLRRGALSLTVLGGLFIVLGLVSGVGATTGISP